MTKILLSFFVGLFIGMSVFFSTLQAQEIVTVKNFTLLNEKAEEISLEQFKDKTAVVVLFTSSHCAWALKYEDRFHQLHDRFGNQNIAFLAINSNDTTMSDKETDAVMRQLSPYPFPYLRDDDKQVAKLFQAKKNPEVFVLQYAASKSAFQVMYHGKVDDNPFDAARVKHNYLGEVLTALTGKEEVPHSFVPPSGCNIK